MKIEHVALWTSNLEQLKTFYERYFQAQAGPKYVNPARQFESYFLTFASGARLELMHVPALTQPDLNPVEPLRGWAHLAMAVGSQAQVDVLTRQLQAEGFTVLAAPRQTGDGYYESLVLDPDGNLIEITI